MTTTDAIAYSTAVIKAKASAATKSSSTLKPRTEKIYPDMPKLRPNVVSKRDTYLKSINAPALKQAAREMGVNIRFNIDPTKWEADNPHLKDIMADLKAKAAEIVKNTGNAAEAEAVDVTV